MVRAQRGVEALMHLALLGFKKMKYKCKHAIQLNGAVIKRDAIVELDDATYKAHCKNFAPLENSDPEVQARFVDSKKQATKRDIITKLEQLGVPYKARDSYEELQQRLIEATTPREIEV